MKTVEKDTIPKCDFCDNEAKYDAPTKDGRWAYMCSLHFTIHKADNAEEVGTRIVKRVHKFVETPKEIKKVMVPLTLDSIAYVKCPYCKAERGVEPDANYTVTCESCGHKYKVYSLI